MLPSNISNTVRRRRAAGRDRRAGGRHQRPLGRKHVGDDVASRFARASRCHQGEVLEGVAETQAMIRVQDQPFVVPTQEAASLISIHPTGVAVDGSKDADESSLFHFNTSFL